MMTSSIKEPHYLVPSSPFLYSSQFNMAQNNTTTFQCNGFSNSMYYNNNIPVSQVHDITNTRLSSFSNNSTSDEADEQQLSLINERKQRRMISNRESARRSRMRKQRHLDELWSQVVWLRNENNQLIDKLHNFLESHDKVLQENAQLKEEASELRNMINDLKIQSPYPNLEDIPCNSAHLRAESSNQSITSSLDLLH